MKKGRVRVLFLCLAAVFVIGLAGEAAAETLLLDGKLKLRGFINNVTGMRLQDREWNDIMGTKGTEARWVPKRELRSNPPWWIWTPGPGEEHNGLKSIQNGEQKKYNLSTCRTTLQLEGEYDFNPDLRFGFVMRGFYDAKWDLDDVSGGLQPGTETYSDMVVENSHVWKNDQDLHSSPRGEHLEYDIDMREWHISWHVGDFFVKAGRQQVVWGEADAIRISDIINALDYSRDFATTVYGLNWEDIRIPQRMIDIRWAPPENKHQLEIELAVTPEDFLGNTYAPYGESFYMIPTTEELYVHLGISHGKCPPEKSRFLSLRIVCGTLLAVR